MKSGILRIALSLTTFAAVVGVVTACSAGGASNGSASAATPSAGSSSAQISTLTFGIQPVKLLNEGTDYAYPDSLLQGLGVEQLMRLDTAGKPVPSLASSVTHPAPTTYVYTLRHGVKFWDGAPLTTADVISSLHTYMQPQSQLFAFDSQIASVTAPTSDTVKIVLKSPDINWLTQSAFTTPIVEAKFAAQHSSDLGAPGVLNMGTGPFEFKNFIAGKEVQMTANPHWWGGAVKTKNLDFQIFTSTSDIAEALRAGSIDGYISRGEDFSQYKNIPGYTLTTAPGTTPTFISVNTKTGPWSDVHVRRALAYLVNRPELIQAAMGGYATPLDTLAPKAFLSAVGTPAQVASFTSSYQKYPYSVADAKKQMAESKYPKGFNTSWTIGTDPGQSQLAQGVSDQLQKVGINVSIHQVPDAQWLALYYGPKSKIQMTSVGYGSVWAGYLYTLTMSSKYATQNGSNTSDYTNPAVDAALVAANQAPSNARSLAELQTVAQAMARDVPYVVVYTPDIGVVLNSKFEYHDLSYSAVGSFEPWATNITVR